MLSVFFNLINSASKNKVYASCNNKDCDKEISDRTSFRKGIDRIAITMNFTGYRPENQSLDCSQTTCHLESVFTKFYPIVDQYSIFQFQDKDCKYTRYYNSTVSFMGGVNNSISSASWYYRPPTNPEIVTSFFSLKIYLTTGKLTGIQFDTNYDNASCLNDLFSEGLPYRCSKKLPPNYDCQNNMTIVQTFVGFGGTDSKGIPLESLQLLPSTFVKFGFGGLIEKVYNKAIDAYDWVKDLFTF